METNYLDMRERYIITQALVVAIKELEKVPAPYTEISNIADMKYLLQTSFAEFAQVVETIQQVPIEVKNNGN